MGASLRQNSRSPYFPFRKYFSIFSHDWCISSLPDFCPLHIPTSPFSSNTFSHTRALILSLFITLGHSLTYLCPTTIFKHLLWCHRAKTGSEAVSLGKLWQRNLLGGELDGTDIIMLEYSNTGGLHSRWNSLSFRPTLCQHFVLLVEQMLVLCCIFRILSISSISQLTPSMTNKTWQNSVHGRQMYMSSIALTSCIWLNLSSKLSVKLCLRKRTPHILRAGVCVCCRGQC